MIETNKKGKKRKEPRNKEETEKARKRKNEMEERKNQRKKEGIIYLKRSRRKLRKDKRRASLSNENNQRENKKIGWKERKKMRSKYQRERRGKCIKIFSRRNASIPNVYTLAIVQRFDKTSSSRHKAGKSRRYSQGGKASPTGLAARRHTRHTWHTRQNGYHVALLTSWGGVEIIECVIVVSPFPAPQQ